MNHALPRLLQLASPALPVGAYTYSQGLEWAIEAGTVRDELTALAWIGDQLEWNVGRYEAPSLGRLVAAWAERDIDAVHRIDADYLASRETAELRAETLQMGHSMRRLLAELHDFPAAYAAELAAIATPTFPCVWSAAAAAWDVVPRDALAAWLWSWAENQVMAALKAVPLGQAAGQRILFAVGARIPALTERALRLGDDETSNFAPGFAIACALHETQYSRLFRS